MTEMFERIISAPIALQLPGFGVILAVILYQIEHVSSFKRYIHKIW